MVRHTRTIFDHPLRSAYPALFPPSPRQFTPIAACRFADLTYGVRKGESHRQIFIANQLGDLVSAEITEQDIDPWSVRVLSLAPHQFLYLAPAQIENLRMIFTSAAFLRASQLRSVPLDSDLAPKLQTQIRALAQLPLFMETCATNGCGPEGWISYFVPNLAYEECCNAHDICYSKGGTEQDRARCDESLAQCIESIGGGGLTREALRRALSRSFITRLSQCSVLRPLPTGQARA